jgi:hypothetical protein
MEDRKYAESPIDLINSDMYEDLNKGILEKISLHGTPKKIKNDYWNAYIAEFNRLIEKGEEKLSAKKEEGL